MVAYPRLTEEKYVDMAAECLYQYVYGANDIFNPHCHDFYEIFITVSGTVTHWINGTKQKLPEGCLVFIRPDDVHGYVYDTPQSTKTAYINLTFSNKTAQMLFAYLSESFPSDALLSAKMPPTVVINSVEKKRLLKQVGELNLMNWQDKNALKMRMRVLLADIFVRFFCEVAEGGEKGIPLWLSSAMRDMERPEHFTAGAERMVELSQKSREHLSRSMKKYYGITTAEYINDLRLNYASNLLLHTNTPVLDICFSCGFQSVSYFYKAFKNKYMLSPNAFRKQHIL